MVILKALTSHSRLTPYSIHGVPELRGQHTGIFLGGLGISRSTLIKQAATIGIDSWAYEGGVTIVVLRIGGDSGEKTSYRNFTEK